MTRAQEAEENYLVKRELATVKQQSEEAGAELEQAKKLIGQLQQLQQQQQQQQPNAVRWAPAFLTGRQRLRSQQERRAPVRPCLYAPLVWCGDGTSVPSLQLDLRGKLLRVPTRHSSPASPHAPTQVTAFVMFHTGSG